MRSDDDEEEGKGEPVAEKGDEEGGIYTPRQDHGEKSGESQRVVPARDRPGNKTSSLSAPKIAQICSSSSRLSEKEKLFTQEIYISVLPARFNINIKTPGDVPRIQQY